MTAYSQAVFTDSVFLLEMSRPAPLHEFLLPHSKALRFPDIRACFLDDAGGLRKVRCYHLH